MSRASGANVPRVRDLVFAANSSLTPGIAPLEEREGERGPGDRLGGPTHRPSRRGRSQGTGRGVRLRGRGRRRRVVGGNGERGTGSWGYVSAAGAGGAGAGGPVGEGAA